MDFMWGFERGFLYYRLDYGAYEKDRIIVGFHLFTCIRIFNTSYGISDGVRMGS